MVTYIPGDASQVGQGLAQIVDAYHRMKNPNLDFQKAMQAHLATNPESIKALADLAKNSPPGFLENLGFGPLGKVIESVPESTASRVDTATREQTVKEATQAADVNVAVNEAALKAVGDPGIAADAATTKLGIGTSTERRAKTAEADIKEAQAKFAPDIAAAAGAQARIDTRRLQAYLDVPELGGEVNVRDFAKKYERGELSMEDISVIYNNPDLKAAFDENLRDIRLDKEIQARKDLQRESDNRADYVGERQTMASIRKAYGDSDYTGSLEAWSLYMRGEPEFYTILEELRSGRPPQNALESDVLEIDNWRKSNRSVELAKDNAKFADFISRRLKDIKILQTDPKTKKEKKLDPQDVAGIIGEINVMLAERKPITGQDLVAVYDDGVRSGFKRNQKPGLKFIDRATNEEVSEGKVLGVSAGEKKDTTPSAPTKPTTKTPATVENLVNAIIKPEEGITPLQYYNYLLGVEDSAKMAQVTDQLRMRGWNIK